VGEPAILPQPGTDDDDSEDGDAQDGGGSVGGLFGLFGCSVNNTMGASSTSSPWAALALGLGAAMLRRRRR
jgi:MYXO-CTERM domain-containing protein